MRNLRAIAPARKRSASMSSVVAVAASSPPITARPSGAFCWPASPKASAIGSMPAIIAQLVIRIGPQPADGAVGRRLGGSQPSRRRFSANVTSRIAFAIATPIAMIAPMND